MKTSEALMECSKVNNFVCLQLNDIRYKITDSQRYAAKERIQNYLHGYSGILSSLFWVAKSVGASGDDAERFARQFESIARQRMCEHIAKEFRKEGD